MLYRILKITDLKDVVRLHYSSRKTNSNGIFALLGKPFLAQYYRVVLQDKYSVAIGAEGEDGKIQGVCFAILDSEKHDKNLKKHKFRLAIGALSSIVTKPSLLFDLLSRYRSLREKDNKFVHNQGCRGGFWVWSPNNKDSMSSYELHERFLAVVFSLGINTLHFEVDKINKNVYKFHKRNGAIEIETITLPDGRERVMMCYEQQSHKIRLL